MQFDEFFPNNPIADSTFRNTFFQFIGTNEAVVFDVGFHVIELESRVVFEMFGIFQDVGGNQKVAMRIFQQ